MPNSLQLFTLVQDLKKHGKACIEHDYMTKKPKIMSWCMKQKVLSSKSIVISAFKAIFTNINNYMLLS